MHIHAQNDKSPPSESNNNKYFYLINISKNQEVTCFKYLVEYSCIELMSQMYLKK